MSVKANSKKNKDYTLPILFGVFAVLLIVMITALCIPKATEFVPPNFETSAVQGTPEVEESMGYTELYKEGMAYRVAACGMPTVDGQNLTVYFTNTEGNEKNLKLRVLDTEGNILGETGLIKPGEYVKNVTLSKTLDAGEKIKLKIMGYEPETYESAGSVSLNVTVGGISE